MSAAGQIHGAGDVIKDHSHLTGGQFKVVNSHSENTNGHCKVNSGDENEEITSGKGEKPSFLEDIFKLLLTEGVEKGTHRSSKVVEFLHPVDLMKKLDLALRQTGENDERLLQLCSDTIKYSVKTGHPHFFNQLFAGLDHYGLAGAWLTETVNTSQYTYEVAPVFTLMEQVVLQQMADCVGYQTSDGLFCPGGSLSNMYGMNLARYHKFPQVKSEGMQGLPRICLFQSDQGHYSIKKSAALLGIGMSYIRQVACDSRGRMDVDDLERQVKQAKVEGLTPFLVNATSGTTVAGAYDPLESIADVCEAHGMWLHVDACWGGGALLSRKHKTLLNGVHRSDSIAWNAHKMMGTPLQCCAFITKHQNILKECHSANATYLFQKDKFYDVSYDTGDKSVQCGRKVDVFKLWLMWKAKGHLGFELAIDNAFACSAYITEQIRHRPDFRLVFEKPQCTNVCFWYIPPCLQGLPETEEWWQKMSKVAPTIKEKMVKAGSMLIGYQPLGDKVNFFRLVIANLSLELTDMDFIVNEIDTLGKDICF